MPLRMIGIAVVAGVLLHTPAQAQTADAAGALGLIRAGAPGTYSVYYLPDRAIISADTRVHTELSVHLPHRPQWGYIGAHRRPASFFAWDEETARVTVQLESGRHEVQIGWEGDGEPPRHGQEIPVLSGGRRIGALTARFTLGGMSAEGVVRPAPARVRLWLTLARGVEQVEATVTVGGVRVSEWRPVRGRLMGRGHVVVERGRLMRVTVVGHGLTRSPVEAVEIEALSPATEAVRVEAMPDDGIIIEAEDFVREGGGMVLVSEGGHHDQHGGKSIYGFMADGHWLEWELEAPEDGAYDLYARVASDGETYREVTVNRRHPAPGFGMVHFPDTGGWARGPGEWQAVQIAGGSDELPPLRLSRGTHTLRLSSILHYIGPNIDYFVLRKRQ